MFVAVPVTDMRKNIHGKVQFHLKEGALHTELHVKPGQKIPLTQLEASKRRAKATGNTLLEKRDTFAINAKKFHHGN